MRDFTSNLICHRLILSSIFCTAPCEYFQASTFVDQDFAANYDVDPPLWTRVPLSLWSVFLYEWVSANLQRRMIQTAHFRGNYLPQRKRYGNSIRKMNHTTQTTTIWHSLYSVTILITFQVGYSTEKYKIIIIFRVVVKYLSFFDIEVLQETFSHVNR